MTQPGTLRRVDAAGIAAILAITGLSYALALRPALQARRERAETTERLQAETLANREAAARVNQLQNSLRQERQAMAAYPIRLSTVSAMNERISDVVALARQCGLNVRSTDPGKLEQGKIHGVVGLRLEGDGGYPACVEFLHRLHSNDKFSDVGVNSISLISQQQSPYEDPLFNFHLLWFVQLEPPGA